MSVLGPEFETLLARFADERWRERKQAVKDLQAILAYQPPPAATMTTLLERLLDGLVGESVPARSTCHEMLVYLGVRSLDGALQRLAAGNRGSRMYVDLLADIGTAEHVPLLTQILHDATDDNVRASAAAALGALGGPAAQQALAEVLGSGSEMLQLFILDALRASGAALAVPSLLPLIDNAVTRRAATALLGHAATPDALELLIPLLRDSMPGVRAAAAVALITLDAALAQDGHPGRVAAALSASVDDSLRQRQRQLVEHRQPEVQLAALELCRMTGDPEVLRLVVPLMAEAHVHARAVRLVACLGPVASPVLQDLATTTPAADLAHVWALCAALKPNDTPDSLQQHMIASLAGEPTTACAAALALGHTGAPACIAVLLPHLAAENPLGDAITTALTTLATHEGLSGPAVQPLLRAASRCHGAAARNLCRILGALGGHRQPESLRCVPPLVAMAGAEDPTVRAAAAQALGAIDGEHEGVTALVLALGDPEATVRQAACRSLGQVGAVSAVQALLTASLDPAVDVRAAAVRALVALNNPVALARLREVVLAEPAANVVIPAIDGVARAGGELDLNLLMSLCHSSNHEVAKAAARGLVGFSAHRATASVLGLLAHDRWDVRWAAAEVLAERGDLTALPPLHRIHASEDDPLVRQVLGGAIARLRSLAAAQQEYPQ